MIAAFNGFDEDEYPRGWGDREPGKLRTGA